MDAQVGAASHDPRNPAARKRLPQGWNSHSAWSAPGRCSRAATGAAGAARPERCATVVRCTRAGTRLRGGRRCAAVAHRGPVSSPWRVGGSGVGGGFLAVLGGAQLLVDAQRFFELVFEDDDAAGGVDGGALVDEVAGAHRDP